MINIGKNGRFDILTAHGKDLARWRALTTRLPLERQDVHLLPEYALLQEKMGQGEALLAVYECGHDSIFLPFLKRELSTLPCMPPSKKYYDIASPYGLGGPVCSALTEREDELYKIFDDFFSTWGRKQRIASEFLCLNELVGSAKLVRKNLSYTVQAVKQVVVVTLDGKEDILLRQMRKGHRSAVVQARNKGVIVEKADPSPEILQACYTLYVHTMKRNSAAERWYFEENFLREHVELLGKEHSSFFVAKVKGRIIAFLLLLHTGHTVSYQFAGSDSDFFSYNAPTLLLYEGASWAGKAGFTRLYLGGGVTPRVDDSLLCFKRGFSHGGFLFSIAWRIHHHETYQELVNTQLEYEKKCGYVSPHLDFFPIYRR